MTYEYFCPANGLTVEVSHSISEKLHSWGELAEKARMELGSTPANAPIERLISGGTLALPRRVSKQTPPSNYDPVLHGDSCLGSSCLSPGETSLAPAVPTLACCGGKCKS